MQRNKTVIIPAKKLFEAFFMEMEKPAIPCQILLSCLQNVY